MNQQAQNALLKTIEEPPAYAVIMLLTTNADSFLQTIRSRCITLNMKSVKDEVIKAYLMNESIFRIIRQISVPHLHRASSERLLSSLHQTSSTS